MTDAENNAKSDEPVDDAKRLFGEAAPGSANRFDRPSETAAERGSTQINIGVDGSRTASVKKLAEALPPLHPNLHPFRDPRHDELVRALEDNRILVLTSYQECAAYAAAYSIATDHNLHVDERKALFPSRRRDRDRQDLELLALTDDEFFTEAPQVLLVEVSSKCSILDSALHMAWSESGRIRSRLQSHNSYLLLAVNEDLFVQSGGARIRHHPVSHLQYLFARDLAQRADELERRLLAAVERGSGAMELPELYQHVSDRLAVGIKAFEEFLTELEDTRTLPLAERKRLLQPVAAATVFRSDSEIHRAAAFVATYFPAIGPHDFQRLVLTLVGDKTTMTERVKQALTREGTLTTFCEEVTERWAQRWLKDPDQVFRDCRLHTIVRSGGSLEVDFIEPYLRREIRAHIENQSPWYLRSQCQTLQDSGLFFTLDLSGAAVNALVTLFVERAVVDPAGFGSGWLLDLVGGLRIQLKGDPPPGPPEVHLAWLLERLELEAQLRAHFYGRLAQLIREMLDREALRPMVREFFQFLVAAKQHDTLLDLVLELARRLRFAPHFDPLVWMRRLLDEGSREVQQRTADRLLGLARENGARIYEFTAGIRDWLPKPGALPERYSVSNRLALEFPFAYCVNVARWLSDEDFGAWPPRHPLFYALPPNNSEARQEISRLVDWVLDPRGAALETADGTDPTLPAEAVRIGFVADLIEHWSWVLDGAAASGSVDGRAVFRIILEEIDARIGARERAWLLRSWRRRQDEYLAQVNSAEGAGRNVLGLRRARLDQLRRQLTELAAQRQSTTLAFSNAKGRTQ